MTALDNLLAVLVRLIQQQAPESIIRRVADLVARAAGKPQHPERTD